MLRLAPCLLRVPRLPGVATSPGLDLVLLSDGEMQSMLGLSKLQATKVKKALDQVRRVSKGSSFVCSEVGSLTRSRFVL